MPAPTTNREVEAIEVRLLLDAIHLRYGFDLRNYAADTMRRRLRALMARAGISHVSPRALARAREGVYSEDRRSGCAANGEMQVILCRNVLIHFAPELRARVLAKFELGLCRGGFFFLGTSERTATSIGGTGFSEFAPADSIHGWWGSS